MQDSRGYVDPEARDAKTDYGTMNAWVICNRDPWNLTNRNYTVMSSKDLE